VPHHFNVQVIGNLSIHTRVHVCMCLCFISYSTPNREHPHIVLRYSLHICISMYGSHGCYSDMYILWCSFWLSLKFLFPVLSKIILVPSFHNLSVICSFIVSLTRKATVPRAKNSYFRCLIEYFNSICVDVWQGSHGLWRV
jgi:hypothetical protein